MTDPREPLGRLVHDTRLAYRAARERRIPSPWEDRDPRLRELDMQIGHAVAIFALAENAATYGISCASCAAHLDRANAERERAERAERKLAEVRQTLSTFLAHYGQVADMLRMAQDLAEGIRQVIDREPLERSDEKDGER